MKTTTTAFNSSGILLSQLKQIGQQQAETSYRHVYRHACSKSDAEDYCLQALQKMFAKYPPENFGPELLWDSLQAGMPVRLYSSPEMLRTINPRLAAEITEEIKAPVKTEIRTSLHTNKELNPLLRRIVTNEIRQTKRKTLGESQLNENFEISHDPREDENDIDTIEKEREYAIRWALTKLSERDTKIIETVFSNPGKFKNRKEMAEFFDMAPDAFYKVFQKFKALCIKAIQKARNRQ